MNALRARDTPSSQEAHVIWVGPTRLEALYSGAHGPLVFHANGKGLRYEDYLAAWHRACDAAECRDCIPHDLRRRAVRNLERAGGPRPVAMKLTGHKTESVYRRYAIAAERDLREGVEKLAQVAEFVTPTSHSSAGA